ncbi:MAG: hypothetical protein JWQ19_916 [Subtercola sp.]|nr:hypothetical protein [Subtercola sp.]
MKRLFGTLILAGILFSVSACTATNLTTAASVASAAVSVAPTADASVGQASSSPADLAAPTPTASSSAIFLPVDSGPQPAANGTVTVDSSGKPESYIVAEGDAVSAIADRFGIFVYGLTQPDGSRLTYDKTLIETGETLTFKTYLPSCRSVPDPNACT